MRSSSIHKLGLSAAACLLAAAAAVPVNAQKMKAEEVVAKHLEAIGAAETRESIKSRIITGAVVATFREPGTGQVGGRSVVASQGDKYAIGMAFDNMTNYPHDKIGYDGKDVSASYVRPGVRSTLGDFLLTHKSVVKNGVFGGALSEAWPLYGFAESKPKLEYAGAKKIGDRQAHEIKYTPRGGSDVRVSLFFDAETFQHVRTEYARTVAAQMGRTPDLSAQQTETRYKMVEEFSDFRKEGGLTLPHVYKIRMEIRAQRGSFDADWEMNFTDFSYNQPIAPETFDVDDK